MTHSDIKELEAVRRCSAFSMMGRAKMGKIDRRPHIGATGCKPLENRIATGGHVRNLYMFFGQFPIIPPDGRGSLGAGNAAPSRARSAGKSATADLAVQFSYS